MQDVCLPIFAVINDKIHTYFHFCCSVAALHWPLAFRSFRSACRLLFVISWHIDRYRKKSRRFIINIIHTPYWVSIFVLQTYIVYVIAVSVCIFVTFYAHVFFRTSFFFPLFLVSSHFSSSLSSSFFFFYSFTNGLSNWFFFFPLLFYSCVTHHHRRVRNELQISFCYRSD